MGSALAVESSVVTGLSGRYALALFALASDSKAIDQVAADLDRIGVMLEQSADLAHLVRAPIFGRSDQARGVLAVLAAAEIGDLVRRFVGVVASNRRLQALPDMISAFRKVLAHHRGEVLAEVTSAQALSERHLQEIRSALVKIAGPGTKVLTRVDPELIGGLVVKLGSRLLDGSIRSKLNSLKLVMKGVG
jgi:F-type H+-transporting ATPase subunit delta